jgi:alanine racemase
MRKVCAHIQLKALQSNAQVFRAWTNTRLCAVVKANAYGHGAEETVCALSNIADCFAVALLDEAKAIRIAACGKDILILTPPTGIEDIYQAAVNGFILTVSDTATARLVMAAAKKYRLFIRVHLKVNTGMNRYGMECRQVENVCKTLSLCPFVQVEGIYSHIYHAETAQSQRELFLQAVDVCRRYYPEAIAHLSATYGATLGKAFAMDMVRVGLGLYGYLPDGVDKNTAHSLQLQKAMRVTADVMSVKKYRYGGAGYGQPTWEKPPKYLTVKRVGYADGVLRKAEDGVCMDATVFHGAIYGKRVTVLGDADEVAKATGTIAYEVLCAATRRAEFIYE